MHTCEFRGKFENEPTSLTIGIHIQNLVKVCGILLTLSHK